MEFKELKLSKEILDATDKMGYEEMTEIQELAIPRIMEGNDVIGLAQTGTGKTAAFALPIIDKLLNEVNSDKTRVLIVTPTRELAMQIKDNVMAYTANTNLTCSVIIGGVNQKRQVNVLKKKIDILVATPGRLVDLLNQHKVDISHIETLVLDEADTMLDMGFIKDIKNIINRTPKQRQTLLFSATMPKTVMELSKEFMHDPITIKTSQAEKTIDKIDQELYYVDSNNKINLLLDILNDNKTSTIIFVRTKHGADKLAKQLESYNIKTSVIHGNKRQAYRVKALREFKEGISSVLIATDIAARGIDINDLGLVVNYDIPEQAELYVHRIGRTARAGKDGKAVTFCSSAELEGLHYIEKLINQKINVVEHKYPMVLKESKPKRGGHSSRPRRDNNREKNDVQKVDNHKNNYNHKDNHKSEGNYKHRDNHNSNNHRSRDEHHNHFNNRKNEHSNNHFQHRGHSKHRH